jgi:predicted transcriptional regulator
MSCKATVSFRLDPDVADQVRAAAEAERRTPSQYLCNLVSDVFRAKQQPAVGRTWPSTDF